jgi:hypothetical protein
MLGHDCSLTFHADAVLAGVPVADDGEEDVLEGRLLLDVFDPGRWE